jgi:TPR repeat protein
LLIRTSIPINFLLHTNTTTAYGYGTPHGSARSPRQPKTCQPLLHHAATLASTDVPQSAYVYGLLLLSEFQVTIPPTFSPLLEVRKHLKCTAYLNYAPAQYKVGHAYEFAQTPFPFNTLLSIQYYSLASQQGEVEADMALSKWFLCGADGAFEKDEALAYTFVEKAARKGLPSAEFAMDYYAEVGMGSPKDLQASVKWYKRVRAFGSLDS